MNTLQINKEYTVPGKCIYWTLGKHILLLKVVLDWVKYEKDILVLPPKQLGVCKDWYFELSNTSKTGTFTCSWNIRRVKNKLELIDTINNNIKPFAINKKLL